jgi:hypothetical protein
MDVLGATYFMPDAAERKALQDEIDASGIL